MPIRQNRGNCGVILLVILALIIGGGFFLKSLVGSFSLPEELKTPRVIVNEDMFARSGFLADERLGKVSDILIRPEAGDKAIAVAGTTGVLYADAAGRATSVTALKAQAADVTFTDVENDGNLELISGGSWIVTASLFNAQGELLWQYGKDSPGVNDITSGDVDGDGIKEFAIGFNGGTGVHLVDKNGQMIWKQDDGNVWHVEMLDTDGDGRSEVVHSNAGGELTLRDKDGKVISRKNPPDYFSGFSLCRWPSQTGKVHAIHARNGQAYVIDFDGEVAAQYPTPLAKKGQAEPKAVFVQLKKDQPEYLAVAMDFGHWDRAILYIYNPNKEIVYQEVLPANARALAVLKAAESETQTLLIGGENEVWQLRALGN